MNLNFKMKKYSSIIAVLILWACTNSALAQGNKKQNDSLKQAKIENLKKIRKDLFTQKLALTPAEAEKFFPIYDEYQLKLKQSRKAFRSKWKGKKPEELTEQEANDYLADAIKLRQTEVELFSTYSEKLKQVISAKKIVMLPKVEKEVQKELVAKAGAKKGPGGNPNKPKKPAGKKTQDSPPSEPPREEQQGDGG